jgi:hypothetical protein
MKILYGILSLQVLIPLGSLASLVIDQLPKTVGRMKFLPDSSVASSVTVAGLEVPLEALILFVQIVLFVNGVVFFMLFLKRRGTRS